MSIPFKDAVGYFCIVVTVSLNSAGILTSIKIIKDGKVGPTSYLPFVTGIVMFTYWLMYGAVVSDQSIVTVNVIGSILQSIFLIIYFFHSDSKGVIVRDAIIGITAILIAFMMAFLPVFDAHYTQILGIACNVLTVIFFASPLATMSQVIKKKTTESMSFPLSLMSAIVTLSWTLYGYLVGDYFVIFPNALGFILAALQLYLFIIYPNTPSQSSLLP